MADVITDLWKKGFFLALSQFFSFNTMLQLKAQYLTILNRKICVLKTTQEFTFKPLTQRQILSFALQICTALFFITELTLVLYNFRYSLASPLTINRKDVSYMTEDCLIKSLKNRNTGGTKVISRTSRLSLSITGNDCLCLHYFFPSRLADNQLLLFQKAE